MTDEEAARLVLEILGADSPAAMRAAHALRINGSLAKALEEMIGTHGEPCAHPPCDARKRAEVALAEARKEKKP